MTAAAQTVGKAALAQTLGWSRPTLDRRLKTDAGFPVVSRGDQSGGWLFDLGAVRSYLGLASRPANAKPKRAPAIDPAQLRDAVAPTAPVGAKTIALPPRKSAHHQGEATAKQRKDAADAALRENKLRVENGELVDRAELRQVLAQVFASLGNDLDALPDEVAKMIERPDEAPRIRALVDKIRTRMVETADPLMAPPSDNG